MSTRADQSAFAKALIPMKAPNPTAKGGGPNLPKMPQATATPPAGMPQKIGVVPPPVLGTAKPGKVGKAYTKGEITIAQEQANIHRRKKTSADRRLGAGTAVGAGGVAILRSTPQQRLRVGRAVADASRHGGADAVTSVHRGIRVVESVPRVGTGLAVAGGLVAAGSLVQRGHHARLQNRHTKVAQDARRRRMAQEERKSIGKRADESAFAKGLVAQMGAEARDGVKRETNTVKTGARQVARRTTQGLRQLGAGTAS